MSDAPRSNRRDFLRGAAGRRALDEATESVDSGESAAVQHPYLLTLGHDAMACRFQVYLNCGQYPQGVDSALAGLELLEPLEEQLTVYRDTSEIVEINQRACDEPVPVESRLFELLVKARELFEATDGAFDVTAGPLVKVWGFYRRQGRIPEEGDLATARERVGMQHVQLDLSEQTISLSQRGMELNLGSIGKGYALDRCGEVMSDAGVNDFLWHGGQSSVLARGDSFELAAKSAEGESAVGWSIGVMDPLQPQRRLGEVRLHNQALATSGASVQFFRYRGKRYGHILDPRSGWPAEGVFSATAIAPTAAEADALSTAFYVLGPKRATDYCEAHPGIGAVIVAPTASGSGVEVFTAGLRPGQWRLAATNETGPSADLA